MIGAIVTVATATLVAAVVIAVLVVATSEYRLRRVNKKMSSLDYWRRKR